jgi:hypothetical protein
MKLYVFNHIKGSLSIYIMIYHVYLIHTVKILIAILKQGLIKGYFILE